MFTKAKRRSSHRGLNRSTIGNLLLVSSILVTSLNVVSSGPVAPGAVEASAITTPQPNKAVSQRPATATIQGHVTWQGRPAPPDASLSIPLTLTLLRDGGYSSDFFAITDSNGDFTIDTPLADGSYTWRVKSEQTLATEGNIVLGGGQNNLEAGTQATGDANNDNCVNATDFNLVKSSFGKSLGDAGYDPRSDFSGDGATGIADFNSVKANFGHCGTPSISNPPPAPTPPPDPSTVAPPLDMSVATDLGSSSRFLYSGDSPIQTGVAEGTIDSLRVAVLRGKVLDHASQPLASVTIQVLSHPELGQTLSRADGMFDMAVNGGGPLTISYTKPGYLSVQRTVQAPWQDYLNAPDVAMLALDPHVTLIVPSNAGRMQVARGSVVSDSDGARQDTLLFPVGTQAYMTLPTGITETLPILHVRATEYTVGTMGPKAMPGDLPPTSGYTNAAEFSVDEALEAGAVGVGFSQPIISYVENYPGFPVGGIVPVGFYDKSRATWVPSANGRIVRVLSTASGMAALDVDGSGNPATPAQLAALGVTDAEREKLASLYQAGQSLWRVPTMHFSSPDRNWPEEPPLDAEVPELTPTVTPREEHPCHAKGSIIACQDQALGEAIAIAGTGFSLHYESDRQAGRTANFTVKIPLSGPNIPASLHSISLEVSVAGQSYSQTFAPGINLSYDYTWDGRDAYGRVVQGAQPVLARIGYTYAKVFLEPAQAEAVFGRISASGASFSTLLQSRYITLWQEWHGTIGTWAAQAAGLGGWSLDVNHSYDTNSRVLYLGNGDARSAAGIGNVITTAAGRAHNGCSFEPCFSGDDLPAIRAMMSSPNAVVIGPDRSLYIGDTGNHRVRKVTPDGIIHTFAGGNIGNCRPQDPCGDGGPATQATLWYPGGLALGPDGSLYISDSSINRVRRVGLDGIITTVAGNGSSACAPGVQGCFSGDGGPAVAAQLDDPEDIAVAADGTLYIADSNNNRIRRVGTDGVISTVAGSGCVLPGCEGFSGDGGPATSALLNYPRGVGLGKDGELYIADYGNFRIREITPDGIIRTVAGVGRGDCSPFGTCFGGDGGLATQARISAPTDVAVGPDGSFYIADSNNSRIRRVGVDGIIATYAGQAPGGFGGDGGPAQDGLLNYPTHLDVATDNVLYFADAANNRVRSIAQPVAGLTAGDRLIASEDGGEVYVFNGNGRHLRTLDPLTGAVVYRFGYDAEGHLNTITDTDNNVTTIHRDGAGKPTGIQAPHGQFTGLSLDGNGYLSAVTDPANESFHLVTASSGLLTDLTGPRGDHHHFTYDSDGRLTRDEDAAGGSTTLSRIEGSGIYTVTSTTAMNRVTTYSVQQLPDGGERLLTIFPSGGRTDTLVAPDGSERTSFADGTMVNANIGPDPRWGMQSPVLTALTVTTPSGLTQVLTSQTAVELQSNSDPFSLVGVDESITVNGQTSTGHYDAGTRVWTSTSAAGRQVFDTLDARGYLISEQEAGLDPENFAYDSSGRLSSTSLGSGAGARNVSFAYDNGGELSSVTDSLGRTAGFAYDSVGRVVSQTLADGRVQQFGYDAAGNRTMVVPSGKPGSAFNYDPGQRLQSYSLPASEGGATYSYNPDGQLTGTTLSGGSAVALGYDPAGRLSSMVHSLGSLSMSYDPETGNLAGITAPGGVALAYVYDGQLKVNEAWTGPVTGSVHATYDNDMRLATESVNGASSANYNYDPDGMVIQAGAMSLSYNSQNTLLSGSAMGSLTDTLGYNSFGEQTAYSATYGGNALFSASYVPDRLGRIVEKTETIAGATHTYSYTYDLDDRLVAVSRDGSIVSGYTYDSNSNRLTFTGPAGVTSGAYSQADRLTAYGNLAYTYTPNGDLRTRTDTATSTTTSYTYDALGNLTAVLLPGGTQITYLVDGQNNRVGKRVNGALVQGFLYRNGSGPVAELDGSNHLVSRFVYGSRGGRVPDYMVKNGITYRIISDYQGSPRLVVDVASGAIAQRMEYDEFGKVLTDTNPGFQPFGFAGGLYDPLTGLVRFGARDYDAETGRWTSVDPTLYNGALPNLYSYVGADPINLTDPSGLLPCPLKKAGRWIFDQVKKLAEKQFKKTKPGKVYEDYEKAKDKLDKANDAANDALDLYEAENDPTLSKPEQGAKWADKGLKWMSEIPGVSHVPFLGDYLKAVGDGARKTLQEGLIYERQQHNTGSINFQFGPADQASLEDSQR